MYKPKLIQVFEHDRLNVGGLFTDKHLKALAAYLTKNEVSGFYSLLYNGVRFNQYVGVIQVDDLTIEVLPKTDKHSLKESDWQQVLIEMLKISLHVEAKTTNTAAVNTRKLNVLDAYLLIFLEEVQALLHKGLIKKYRKNESNQNVLKGRIVFNQHLTKNLVHAEKFFVQHSVYDKNNVYNSILYKALNVIARLSVSSAVKSRVNTTLFDFPECDDVKVLDKLFSKLVYDRKTTGYKKAIELARIILMNFHPDFKGGRNNILAIMVDMNELWENYIYFTMVRAVKGREIFVRAQNKKDFWIQPGGYTRTIRPDIVVDFNGTKKNIVLDTKWKYQSKTSVEDARQMYAYGHYFNSEHGILLYPNKFEGSTKVEYKSGNFIKSDVVSFKEQQCGLLWVDLIDDENQINKNIGTQIIAKLLEFNKTIK